MAQKKFEGGIDMDEALTMLKAKKTSIGFWYYYWSLIFALLAGALFAWVLYLFIKGIILFTSLF